jgi:CRISPR/Cas system CMR-associated protein Cmr5 small subunit
MSISMSPSHRIASMIVSMGLPFTLNFFFSSFNCIDSSSLDRITFFRFGSSIKNDCRLLNKIGLLDYHFHLSIIKRVYLI